MVSLSSSLSGLSVAFVSVVVAVMNGLSSASEYTVVAVSFPATTSASQDHVTTFPQTTAPPTIAASLPSPLVFTFFGE